ncbi:MAG: hypothetical protein AAF438_20015 [Pseudomonadota bacterium]
MAGKRAYLSAMGIDVWVRRTKLVSQRAPQSTQPVHEVLAQVAELPSTESAKPKSVTTPPANPDQPVPRFSMAFFHYVQIGICVALRGTGGPIPKRLCDDIARFAGGDVKAARFQQLDWPMLSNKGIDQSVKAAQEVVTQKFTTLPERVLVLGAGVAEYFGPLKPLESLAVAKFGKQQLMMVKDLEALQQSAAEKKALMIAISSWK